MLLAEAVFAIRSLCQDLLSPTRYTDADIAVAINNGLALAYRLRPDLFVGLFEVPSCKTADLTDGIALLPIDDMYAPALTEHAAGWLMLRDDEYTADGRASALLASFRSSLQGVRSTAA
jgi:hypothetical protein